MKKRFVVIVILSLAACSDQSNQSSTDTRRLNGSDASGTGAGPQPIYKDTAGGTAKDTSKQGVPCSSDNDCGSGQECQDGYCCTVTVQCYADQECEDHNESTLDSCVDGHCFNTPKFGPQPDCVVSSDCNDRNVCTVDTCVSGKCEFTAIPGACQPECTQDADCHDDGNPCTSQHCIQGKCEYKEISDCHPPECATVADCNDGKVCTVDSCQNGVCLHGATPNCKDCVFASDCGNDNNVCTTEACEAGRCKVTFNEFACDDNDSGTENDICHNGVCVGTVKPPPAECTTNAQCADLAHSSCERAVCMAGKCIVSSDALWCECSNAGDCYDSNACTADACVPFVGVAGDCYNQPIDNCPGESECPNGNVDCDDNNACTQDMCLGKKCFHEAIPGCIACPLGNSQCPDPLQCHTYECVADRCEDSVTPNVSCDDGNASTTNDRCTSSGICVGTSECSFNAECNDTDYCTTDTCVSGKCYHEYNTATCDDGLALTINDHCTLGTCKGTTVECVVGVNVTKCDDGNSCTTDSCVGNSCVNSQITGCCTTSSQCNDSNSCSSDACIGNSCVYTPIAGCCSSSSQCDDSNVCTTDSCSASSCSHTAISGCCTSASQCNDNNSGTTDTCVNNKCVFTQTSTCGDNFCDTSKETWNNCPTDCPWPFTYVTVSVTCPAPATHFVVWSEEFGTLGKTDGKDFPNGTSLTISVASLCKWETPHWLYNCIKFVGGQRYWYTPDGSTFTSSPAASGSEMYFGKKKVNYDQVTWATCQQYL